MKTGYTFERSWGCQVTRRHYTPYDDDPMACVHVVSVCQYIVCLCVCGGEKDKAGEREEAKEEER